MGEERPDEIGDVQMTFSSGIAFSPQAGTTLAAVTKAADLALYRAKVGGRDRDVFWGDFLAGFEPASWLDTDDSSEPQDNSIA